MIKASSPWPDITGQLIYLVESEKALETYIESGGQGWTFYQEEYNLLLRERKAGECLLWRGEHGTFLGDEKSYEENRERWRGGKNDLSHN